MIFLESENKKLKLMFEQNMANLNQRIKMLQEKEKKARKDKNDMMEMLDEINFNDEVHSFVDLNSFFEFSRAKEKRRLSKFKGSLTRRWLI